MVHNICTLFPCSFYRSIVHTAISVQVPMGLMPPGTGLMPDSAAEIAQQIDVLRHRTTETGKLLRQMEQEQENFALHYHECTKLNGR